jgi:fructosamine-3-kinase
MWNLLVENCTLFSDVQKPSLVHWDLWEGNVFVKDKKAE